MNSPVPPDPAGPPRGLRRHVALSTLSNAVGQVAVFATWFLLTPFLLGHLGTEVYALFVLATALMGYGALLDLGVTSSVIRFVAELRARGDLEGLRAIVATGFALSSGLCVVTIAVGAALAPFAPRVFGVPESQHDTAVWLVVLTAVTAGLAFPTGTLSAVLRGLQRFDLSNALAIVSTLAVAAGTVAAVWLGGGVLWVVGVAIPIALVMQVPAYLAVRRAAPDLALLSGRPRRELLGRIASFGWAVLVVQGASQIKTRTDEIVIAAVLPVVRVTPYALARRVAEAPQMLTYQFVKVLMPLSADLGVRHEPAELRRVLITATRVTIASYLITGAACAVLAGPFLAAWVGPEFRDAGTILVVLVLANLADTATWPAVSMLQGISRHRPVALFAILGALLNLGLSIVLIHWIGPTGVALGTLIAAVTESLLLITPYAMRVMSVPAGELVRDALLPAVLPLVPAVAIGLALDRALDPASLVSLFAIGALTGGTYLAGFLLAPPAAAERGIVTSAARALAGLVGLRASRRAAAGGGRG